MRDSEDRAYDGLEGSLEERVRQLEPENDIPRAAAKVLKAESPSAMTNREKALVIKELRSGDDPVMVSEKAVRRIMREEGLSVAYAKRRARYSSYKGEISDAPDNLANRHFRAAAPNELRLTDITEFGLPGGKACLSPILDCFDGGLPAWSIGTGPNVELANGSLEAACGTLREGQRPVSHSDRGCHYRWPGWIAICDENHLIRSMSKKGCSPDSSATEGFFGRLKDTDNGNRAIDEGYRRKCA